MNQLTPKASGPTSRAAQTTDACDLLLAELQARRVRLQKLLRLVQLEAIRLSAEPARPQHRETFYIPRLKRPA
jgi:hypothetical protein